MNLSKSVKVTRALNSVAAGQTNQNGSVIDMSGFEGVQFIALFGALTATQVTSLKVQQGKLAEKALAWASSLIGSGPDNPHGT